jgi:LuxR family maltose regulon positive regulatory protein
VSGYTIQPGKVQPPPLREETLARHRLLDWLDVKIHNRLVFVIADAGYGKTTLLADFSRRTRLRTLWYRMDGEDRNWVAFLSYLLAAGRVHDPDFGPRTAALLQNTGPGGANRDDVVEAFLRELPATAGDGAVLILDDFHVADDVPDVIHIARELVARAPERLTLVISSRRVPPLPVARLRALGEVAELRTTDLRFSAEETEALFAETYGRALEPDVLADLSRRTDGWAASLHLVRTALRDRSAAETRAFIRSLSGAQSELYDYLAEEVVGDLPVDLQSFLMRTSVLQTVESEAAEIATGFEARKVATHIAESERLGLLSRRQVGLRSGHGYHPLVREFLEARLGRDAGEEEVAQLHRSVARWAESRDWAAACHHYAAAGDVPDLHRMLDGSIESIVGTGEIALAADYLTRFPPEETTANYEVIRSREAGTRMDIEAALHHAVSAVELEPESDVSLGNLLAIYFLVGDQKRALALATRLAEGSNSPTLRMVGTASKHLIAATLAGSLGDASSALRRVAEESRRGGLSHYHGVSLLNIAQVSRVQGNAAEALRHAAESSDILAGSSGGSEVIAAELTQAWAHAHLGQMAAARDAMASALQRCIRASRLEWLTEAAAIEASYGDEDTAQSWLDEARTMEWNESFVASNRITQAQLALRVGNASIADDVLPREVPSTPTLESGYLARYLCIAAHLALQLGRPDAELRLNEARAFADRQGAGLWVGYCQTLSLSTSSRIDAELERLPRDQHVFLSIVAEAVIAQLGRMSDQSMDAVIEEAQRRPERWKPSLRRAAQDAASDNRIHAARILDIIGDKTDVLVLRGVARSIKASRADASLGRNLARRLADRVFVEDLGRLEIRVGSSVLAGTDLRRKVLAMLCFLLSRPRYAATRDEVVEALWPDLMPEAAVNSLNQTVYFLRRVFEPGYKEEISAGYVGHASDVIWLDAELIRSRSQVCRDLIASMGSHRTPEAVDELSQLYAGRFALDFAYEDWATPFRDSLHISYLQVVEEAVASDMATGHYERGISLAKRALAIDPELESLELYLLRMLRITGAHAAAAEQYGHYAAYLRNELGVEPPPLASL